MIKGRRTNAGNIVYRWRDKPHIFRRILRPSASAQSAVIDTAAFSMSSIFSESPALDIFGDAATSGARRRCRPNADDTEGLRLFDLHLRVAVMYAVAYAADGAMPFCTDLAPLMEERGHPLSILEGETTTNTPWGLGGSRHLGVSVRPSRWRENLTNVSYTGLAANRRSFPRCNVRNTAVPELSSIEAGCWWITRAGRTPKSCKECENECWRGFLSRNVIFFPSPVTRT